MPVYFIKPDGIDTVKIGYSKDIAGRLATLQTSSWAKLSVLATINDDDFTEKDLHLAFRKFRVRGEWFVYNNRVREFLRAYAMNPSYASCFISTEPLSKWVGHTSSYR
jgi:Meiotically up-regulated gene 113